MSQAYATTTDLIAVVPEVGALDPSFVDFWLITTKSEISLALYGSRSKFAHVLKTLHNLAQTPAGERAGLKRGREVLSHSKAGLAVTYAVAEHDGPNSSTLWGRAFDGLSASVWAPPVVA